MQKNEHSQFKLFLLSTQNIISNDLDKLQNIADDTNDLTNSTTTTTQTTRYPGDDSSSYQQSGNISRCTIPIAMVCFSFIDMIGQWVNEFDDDDFGNSADAFFTKLANTQDLKSTDTRRKFKEQFRHGIMHGFFSKKGFSVTYPGYDGSSLFCDIHDNGATLDVRYLLKIVRKVMAKLNREILDENSEHFAVLFKGYQKWLDKESNI